MVKAEILISEKPTMHISHIDLVVLFHIPEGKIFERSWRIISTQTNNEFSLYKEICHNISTSFADMIKDIEQYEKYGVKE